MPGLRNSLSSQLHGPLDLLVQDLFAPLDLSDERGCATYQGIFVDARCSAGVMLPRSSSSSRSMMAVRASFRASRILPRSESSSALAGPSLAPRVRISGSAMAATVTMTAARVRPTATTSTRASIRFAGHTADLSRDDVVIICERADSGPGGLLLRPFAPAAAEAEENDNKAE